MTIDTAKIAEEIKRGEFLPALHYEEVLCATYVGKIKAKERARSGKGGRMFTPKETREFESAVKAWGTSLAVPPVAYPIRVLVTVYEGTLSEEQIEASKLGLRYNEKGDIDNLAKSILDGLNGVVYKDDKQISELTLQRRWAETEGFRIRIWRNGLTKLEYENVMKRVRFSK